MNRCWWKQGWDQVCLATVLPLRKQATFRDAITGFPEKWCLRNKWRNSILTKYRYPDSDWSCCVRNLLQPIRSTTQIRVVTRHQYGISLLVSQTSFSRRNQWWRRENVGCFLTGGILRVIVRLFLLSINPSTPKIWFSLHGLSVKKSFDLIVFG